MSERRDEAREAMLADLLSALDRHHRRRRGRRRAAALALTAAATAGAWVLASRPARPPAPEPVARADLEVRPDIRIVRGQPRTGRIETVDDDGLLAALSAIDRPAGLIRIGGEVRLTAAVTDETRRPRGSDL